MQKATTDDIGAICSRIDAQTVIMIEMLSAINNSITSTGNNHGVVMSASVYCKRYDNLAERFRKGMVDF